MADDQSDWVPPFGCLVAFKLGLIAVVLAMLATILFLAD